MTRNLRNRALILQVECISRVPSSANSQEKENRRYFVSRASGTAQRQKQALIQKQTIRPPRTDSKFERAWLESCVQHCLPSGG
jgi:hypothetical protein